MRVSLRWLRELIELPTEDPDELEEVLASLGMEVDAIERLQAPFRGVVVARVDEVIPHPNADRIRLCRVTTTNGIQEVVCGAWNFESGAIVPLARPGAILADGTEVDIRTIRGVTSHGMICSERELGLGEDAEGILVLDGDFELGSDFAEALPFPDVVFELEIEANRPDEMSMVGVARELAAFYGVDVKEPGYELEQTGPASKVSVQVKDPVGCPRFLAIPLDRIAVGPSPLWMRLRLRAAGVRPINNVVDVTNYVMLELGQPLHAFDLDSLAGEKLVVRRATEGERLRTLDGTEREFGPDDLVICDAEGVVSVAGLMGGETSEVSDVTTRVLLEAAHWDPPTIMEMSLRLGLRTEASARFSRGTDPNLPPKAARRAAQLMVNVAGARASTDLIDIYPEPIRPWSVEFRLSEVPRLLGRSIDRNRVVQIFESLRMTVAGTDPLIVTVPTWRPDVTRPADLVEEVARLFGYDEFPETLPMGTGGGLTSAQIRTRRVRQVLVGAGFFEAQTFSFMGSDDLDRLQMPEHDVRRHAISLKNPISEDEGLLRTTLLPGLLKAAARNLAYGASDVALFELGRVFYAAPDDLDRRIPSQPQHVAFVALGAMGPKGMHARRRPVDVYTSTGAWNLLARALGLGETSLRADRVPGFHPGRGAEVLLDGDVVGTIGELHPGVARAYELSGRVAVGELSLEPLLADRGPWQLEEPSTYPPVRFDLAFEVDETVTADGLLRQVRTAGGALLESVELFDEFRGGSLPAGRKSLAVRIVLRALDHTLTQDEVQQWRDHVVVAVERGLGARLRGRA
jgi:phenylalanyl-tRNA synthetase beta chain